MNNEYFPFINLPLAYAYDALEPYIDARTMELHHDRHLKTYVDKLNQVLNECPKLQKISLTQLIRNAGKLPREVREEVRNNAGGVYNHRFYFYNLSAEGRQEPQANLAEAINRCFGSTEIFCGELKNAATSVFGSGYAWLVLERGKLKIMTTPNQNCPLEQGCCPILNVDVWEHAYYLKHYNLRADYFDDWFCVINWRQAEENYLRALNCNI